jgi:hypothetical protein
MAKKVAECEKLVNEGIAKVLVGNYTFPPEKIVESDSVSLFGLSVDSNNKNVDLRTPG